MKTRDAIRGRDYLCAVKPNSIIKCCCEAEIFSAYINFLPTCHCDDKIRKRFYFCNCCLEQPLVKIKPIVNRPTKKATFF